MVENKEFVPYEIALALKELGFNETCFGYWNRDPYLPKPTFNLVKPFIHEWCVPAPLKQQAFKFFREKHGLIGLPRRDFSRNYNGWWFEIFKQKIKSDNPILLDDSDYINFETYEEAELACLRKLIEIAKETK
jgi:hypothetical protein